MVQVTTTPLSMAKLICGAGDNNAPDGDGKTNLWCRVQQHPHGWWQQLQQQQISSLSSASSSENNGDKSSSLLLSDLFGGEQ
mmetsp:Transcript_6204/g.13370  ORF Transcript_6204/g.13370 Transcript_6204/m.13370 type:complete len:82 (-) Transcript_6204:185-430(-)